MLNLVLFLENYFRTFIEKARLPYIQEHDNHWAWLLKVLIHVTISFFNNITDEILSQIFPTDSITIILSIMSVPYECYFCLNLRLFFTKDWSLYITHEAIFLWYLEPFKPPLYILNILCETTLNLHIQNSFVVTKWRIMSRSWTLYATIFYFSWS